MKSNLNEVLGRRGNHVEREPNPRERAPVDETAATELRLFADNESTLYRQKLAIVENLKKKKRAGRYDAALAPKLWLFLVDEAAKMYAKEFASPGEWATIFTRATRMEVAREVAEDEGRKIDEGYYGAAHDAPRGVLGTLPRHGNPVPPSHAVHGWAKLNRISREMTGRDYRDLPDDGPEQDAVMRAYERDEDAMAAEYGRHGNPAGGMFHVVAKNDRTGREYLLTGAPVTHQEGVTIMSKQSRPARDVRIMLVPAGGARHGNPTWSRDRREQFDRARREEAQGTLATDEELAEALGDLEVPPNASVSLYHTPVGDRFRVYAGNRLHETSLLRHELPAAFAAIEAEGDERHGNPVHPSARERGFARHGEGQERMTIARAREILTPLGIVIKRTDPYTDEWRVNFRGGTEGTATYETDIPSAVLTGQAMAADRARHGNPLY